MFKKRKSDDHLHTDVILSKISDFDIFSYYCPSFKEIGKKFCSELREDNNPTASIIPWNRKLLYKDFGYSEHTLDCFNYVRVKFGCSFYSALRIIDCDFNLGLSSKKAELNFTMGYLGYVRKRPTYNKPLVIIKKKRRSWNKEDATFWSKYLINRKILTKFGVEPISHYWVNEYRFTCKSASYAFRLNKRFKIYCPYEKNNKWTSNTKKADIQGWNQLPQKGNLIILTSSLKDVMCLNAAGYDAIALQSEMQIPEAKIIDELKERFNEIIVFYDNDFDKESNPGQITANKICDLYGLTNVCIPTEWKCKDPSDLVKTHGSFNKLKSLL
tara:strand:- start:438 stop:1421 length:984 start_codon:yes stop_codon:yes gene_type:complete